MNGADKFLILIRRMKRRNKMGQLVFILGRSGTGKSYSLRTFPKDKIAVINVQGKILPFKGAAQIESTPIDQSDKIVKALEIYGKKYKSIVIDDYQYTMANEFMRRSAERGYDKFTEIGRHAWDIANKVRELPNDVIVYVMCHTDRDDEGNEKIKTIGKLLDEKICLEGMSTIVLKTNVTDGVYSFLTQNNGKDTVKSPAGMFPSYAIENDLNYVDQKIRNYYELGEFLSDEDMAEIDETVKHGDIPIKEEKKTRRGKRGEEKKEEPTDAPQEKEEEKPKRSKRIKDDISDDNRANEEIDGGSVGEQPKRRSRKKVKEEVDEKNLENEKEYRKKVMDKAAEMADGAEEIPFETYEKAEDQVEKPAVEEAPKRKRRTKAETQEEVEKVSDMIESAESVETTVKRRRRRS